MSGVSRVFVRWVWRQASSLPFVPDLDVGVMNRAPGFSSAWEWAGRDACPPATVGKRRGQSEIPGVIWPLI